MTTISVLRAMSPLLRGCGLPCGLLLALVGCGTPQPVRDLASVSAANVSVVRLAIAGLLAVERGRGGRARQGHGRVWIGRSRPPARSWP